MRSDARKKLVGELCSDFGLKTPPRSQHIHIDHEAAYRNEIISDNRAYRPDVSHDASYVHPRPQRQAPLHTQEDRGR